MLRSGADADALNADRLTPLDLASGDVAWKAPP